MKSGNIEVDPIDFSERLKMALSEAMLMVLSDGVQILGLEYKNTEREVIKTTDFHGIAIKSPSMEKIMNLEIRYLEKRKAIK